MTCLFSSLCNIQTPPPAPYAGEKVKAAAEAAAVREVEVIGTRTACDARGRAYTLFRLRVEDGRAVWEVQRRFRQFKELAARLVRRVETQAASKLPSSMYAAPWSLGSSVDPQLVAQRAIGLQAFLREALLTLPPGDALLNAFLRDEGEAAERQPSQGGRRGVAGGLAGSGQREAPLSADSGDKGRGGERGDNRTRAVLPRRFDPPALVRAVDMEWRVMWEEPLAVA